MEIKYEKDDFFGLTDCPHKRGTAGAVYTVGSIGCQVCRYFKAVNTESQTVTCNHPGGEM